MSWHRYSFAALAGDYARAGAGIALTAAPLVLMRLNTLVEAICAALVALFAVFGALTAFRHFRAIEVGDEAIAARGPLPVELPWDALDGITLRYYATRRDGGRGWMELVLRGAGRRLMLDSRIDGFAEIVRHAASVVQRRHLPITAATAANFAALGIPMSGEVGEHA